MICIAIMTLVIALAQANRWNKHRIQQPGLCSVAAATFDGSLGVTGFVQVNQDGDVDINLDTTDLDASICNDDGASGFTYHIHESWTYGALDLANRYGPTDCGSSFTGGHYNPYSAPVCSLVEDIDYFNCEVGDLSGRFGPAEPDSNDKIRIDGCVASAHCGKDCDARLNPESIAGKSIVFHCKDGGARLFCAGFDLIISS